MSATSGVDQIIDHHLRLENIGKAPHYEHKKSALELSQGRPPGFDAQKLIFDLYSYLSESWDHSSRKYIGPSKENWRFEKQPHISEGNKSLEKILEKRIIGLPGHNNWVNQVPTASGLFTSSGDRHRDIDLVRMIQPGEYEFMELKIASDNPLKAAMEVLQYGVLYIFSRCNYSEQDLNRKRLLSSANYIHLSVLAPNGFYERRYSLGWLAHALDAGLKSFITDQNLPFNMDFQYKTFPHWFNFCQTTSDEEIVQGLNEITLVRW